MCWAINDAIINVGDCTTSEVFKAKKSLRSPQKLFVNFYKNIYFLV